MGFAKKYITKNEGDFLFSCNDSFAESDLIVVIPCFDEPEIATTIHSLFNCHAPKCNVIILIVVNDFENCPSLVKHQNQRTIIELEELNKTKPQWVQLHYIYAENLPIKNAGAGWARKIGMDWAITHFETSDNANGVIISLDADTTVSANYFEVINNYFHSNRGVAATIYFEHPLDNNSTSEAITMYELYMRYYKHALHYIGFPNSIYTVGSAFAVRAQAYVDQGGMNRRKAGEDFYFLHKLLPLGSIGEINDATVYPSARLSNRVPFGTGPILQKFIDGDRDLELTYPFEAFLILKPFFERTDFYYEKSDTLNIQDLTLNSAFQEFCYNNGVLNEILTLRKNCSTKEIFWKRFFHVFNAFKILKWLNYAIANGFSKESLMDESLKLIEQMGISTKNRHNDPKLMLKLFREIDKARSFA